MNGKMDGDDTVSMTEKLRQSTSSTASRRKPLISPTSSFVDFAVLDTEIYTEEDIANAYLYEPHHHRNIKKPTTDFETSVHLLKGSIGAGLLATPKAFYHAGVLIGVPGTILLGLLCVYGIHVLLTMQYEQCQRLKVPFLTLPRSMKIAFLNGPRPLHKLAWLAPFLVDFFLVANQIGLCATYIAFIAESVKNLLEPRLIKDLNLRFYMLCLFLPVLLINFIRNLKRLTPVSLVADFLIAIAIGCCFYYIFGVGEFRLDEVKMVAPVSTWPLFIGTIMFALEAVGVMIALEHNMKNPQNFLGRRGIFPWCMLVVISLYLSIGLCSYLRFGEETQDTIISSLPRNEWLSDSVQLMIALSIYGSYPLQCYVGLEIIWGNYIIRYIKDHNKEYCIEYVMRTTIVIITFILAMIIPHVDLVISLVGAFCLSTLGLIIPFLLELCTLWPNMYGRCYYILFKDIILILLGFGILIIGTTISIDAIVEKVS